MSRLIRELEPSDTSAHQNNTIALMIRCKLSQAGEEELITGGVFLTRLHHLTAQLHHLQTDREQMKRATIMRKSFDMRQLDVTFRTQNRQMSINT